MADNNADDQFLVNNSDDTNPQEEMKENQELPEDNDTPFSTPDDVQSRVSETAPVTDTNVDDHEAYDANTEEAAGVEMPGLSGDQPAADNESDKAA